MRFLKNELENNIDVIKKISYQFNISEQISSILVGRGCDSLDKVNKFLNPTILDLHDPFLLNGMREAKVKIEQAIKDKQRILIFGDYDVDGISATSILYKYLKNKVENLFYYLPNRYEDGYGLSIENCQKVIDKFNPNLIITVDCGISCKKEVDFLMSKGVDVIITDHHDIPQEIPNCICINAKLPNQAYPFKYLCGAGVALKLVQAFVGIDNLTDYLPICAIATVADIVSLTDENRAIVCLGLKLTKNLPIGVQMLLKNLNINIGNLTSSDISFKLAPKINAAGRLGDAKVSLKLFISDNKKEIFQNIDKLTEMNNKRQVLCNRIYKECEEKLSRNSINRSRFIILQDKNWDSGLLGIVCARLLEEYNRPAFLFSNVNGLLHGSVRSLQNINIHDVLSSCGSTLETFGGHSVAAGLTLKEENYSQFISELNDYFSLNFSDKDFDCEKYYDLDLDSSNIDLNFVKELSILEPFGCENPKPLFCIKWNNNSISSMKNYPEHINVKINPKLSLVGFNMGKLSPNFMYFQDKTAIVDFQLNEFKGKVSVKGLIKNVIFENYSHFYQDMFVGEYTKQLVFQNGHKKHTINNYETKDLNSLLEEKLTESSFGTLIVVNRLESFDNIKPILKKYNVSQFISKVNTNKGENACVMNLVEFMNVKNYQNVIFVDGILSFKYLSYISNNIYVPHNSSFGVESLKIDTTRATFIAFYKAFEGMAQKEIKTRDEYSFYVSLKRMFPNLKNYSFAQFVACLYVFSQLKIVDIWDGDNYSLNINKDIKNPLENSKIYSNLKLINKIS